MKLQPRIYGNRITDKILPDCESNGRRLYALCVDRASHLYTYGTEPVARRMSVLTPYKVKLYQLSELLKF
jgi:hypothetical protein